MQPLFTGNLTHLVSGDAPADVIADHQPRHGVNRRDAGVIGQPRKADKRRAAGDRRAERQADHPCGDRAAGEQVIVDIFLAPERRRNSQQRKKRKKDEKTDQHGG